jgi:hypothetical protein
MPALIALSGCAATTPPEDANVLGERPPFEYDPEPGIRRAMEGVLKDPFTAQYRRVGGPVPGQAQQALLAGGAIEKGWGYCYMVNAKNSFGAYTGFQPYYFVVRYIGAREWKVVGAAANPQLSSWNCFR